MSESPRPELLSFLGAIKADPEEDTPKLALADWLQEQPEAADQARGEFLRQFVRNNQLSKTDPAREDFGALSRLWNANEKAWAGRLKAVGFKVWATNHMFRWGLLFPVLDWPMSGDAAALAESEEYAWVAGVAVRAADSKAGQAFIESPLLPSLVGLRVAASDGAAAVVGHLFASPRGELLRSLEIESTTGDRVYGVAHSPHLDGLRRLAVNRFAAAHEFGWLCDAPHLRGLRALDVSGAGLGAAAGHQFANGPGLPALEELNFGPRGHDRNRLGDAGAVALAEGPRGYRLRRLSLASNDVTEAGARALLALPRLTHLDLSDNRLSNATAIGFARAGHFAALEELNLSHTGLTHTGVAELAESPHLGNIRRLDLRGNRGIGNKAAKALRKRFGDRVILDPN